MTVDNKASLNPLDLFVYQKAKLKITEKQDSEQEYKSDIKELEILLKNYK